MPPPAVDLRSPGPLLFGGAKRDKAVRFILVAAWSLRARFAACVVSRRGPLPALLDNLDFCDTPSSTKAHLMATLHKLLADKKARQQVCQLGAQGTSRRQSLVTFWKFHANWTMP